jgi:hypothetical protein
METAISFADNFLMTAGSHLRISRIVLVSTRPIADTVTAGDVSCIGDEECAVSALARACPIIVVHG